MARLNVGKNGNDYISFLGAVYDNNVKAVLNHLIQGKISVPDYILASDVASQNKQQDILTALNLYSHYRLDKKNSMLHLAISNKEFDLAKMLIESGADVNASNNNNDTPLLLAINAEQTELVDFLLNHGASLNKMNNQNQNAVVLARMLDHPETVACVLKHALLNAAAKGEVDVVRPLLHQGIDVDSCNAYGNTALHLAAFYCQTNVVKCLLEADADVNRLDYEDRSALVLAACKHYQGNQQEETVLSLLSAGADIESLRHHVDTIPREIKTVIDDHLDSQQPPDEISLAEQLVALRFQYTDNNNGATVLPRAAHAA